MLNYIKPLVAATTISLSFSFPAIANENAKIFGKRPDILSIALSPKGEKLVWVAPGPDNSTRAFAINIDGGQPQMFIELDGKPTRLRWCEFVSEERVVCSVRIGREIRGDLVTKTTMMSVNIDSTNLQQLGKNSAFRRSSGWIINWLKEQPNKVMFVDGYGIRMMNTETGKFEDNPYSNDKAHEENATSYIDDETGTVKIMGVIRDRGATGYFSNSARYYYRQSKDDDWDFLSSYEGSNNEGFVPIEIDNRSNEVLGLQKHQGLETVFAVSLDGSLNKRMVYHNPKVDVSELVRLGRGNRIIGAKFADDREEIHYLDDGLAKLAKGLGKALPGLPNIDYVDASNDEKKLLLVASGDTDPGRYYIYNAENRAIRELLLLRPDLENFKTAQVKPIRYKSRDGTEIPGFLTIPAGSAGKNLPAIVMPHGGPQARDTWGFDWWAQFYAAEGYAVLQPNFRGSAGYGEDWFVENGFKSWETAVGDINDAGSWMIAKGIANPDRLAIVGWSYGGYAALQSGVYEPGLFKTIIAVAPVTDLGQLKADFKRYKNYTNTKEFIGSGRHIRSGSPARHASRIQVPVLLIHGTKDFNVNVDHSKKMADELNKLKKINELVIFEGQNHQIPDPETRTDMLARSSAFLKKHLNDD